MADKSSLMSKITKIIFIGGAILFFVLLAYLIITWVPRGVASLANLGSSVLPSSQKEGEIVITSNQTDIISGKAFNISWDYEPTESGEYYFKYSCIDSLNISIKSSSGSQKVLCETPFRLGSNLNSISLTPTISQKNIFIDPVLTILYRNTENGDEIAQGETTLAMKNVDASNNTSNPYNAELSGSTVETKPQNTGLVGYLLPKTTTNTNTNTSNKTNTIYGKADLQISNIREVGDSALAFDVFNVGTQTSGSWYFTYTDAENPSKVILSPIQMSLAPGQGLLTTVRYDSQANDSQLINIIIDPYNSISESNESNNRSYVTIHGDENSGSNNYNSNDDADLVIEDIQAGRMSGSRFVENDQINEDDTAAVKFVVRNQGGESTGTWKYKLTNTPNGKTYNSSTQSSLRPGEEKTITVKFDGLDRGTFDIKVKVDSNNDVDEESESNNTEEIELEVTN